MVKTSTSLDGTTQSVSKTGFNIRDATLDDIEELLLMAEEFTTETDISEMFNKEHMRLLYTTYIPHVDGVCIVLTKEDKVVGVIGGVVAQHTFNPEVVILSELLWFVSKTYRKSMQSIKLFKRFEQEGIRLGATQVYVCLRSNLKDQSVQRVYERLGYTEKERTYVKKV